MLTCKNGRFYYGVNSFAVPDGVHIHPTPDALPPHGLVLLAPDKSYTIDVLFECGEGGAQKSLEAEASEFMDSKIKARTYNGKTAWCGVYKGPLYSYFDARIEIPQSSMEPEDDPVNIFRVIVTAPYGADIRAIRRSAAVVGLLNSLEP